MSWWEDLKDDADELWSGEKDKIKKDSRDQILSAATKEIKHAVNPKKSDRSVRSDSAAIPNANQQVVDGGGGKKPMNWQAIGAGVGLLGILSKFVG